MAKPFGQTDNSGKHQEESAQCKKGGNETNLPSQRDEKRAEGSSEHSGASSSDQRKHQQKENPQCKEGGKGANLPSQTDEKSTGGSSEYSETSSPDQPDALVANVYCIMNSKHLNCGPTFINVISNGNKISHVKSPSKGKRETERKIKIRKGVLNSTRNITEDDIKIVARDVEEDWKKLLKKLPGITLSNLCFHQAFVNAMDRRDSTSMAEIALTTWKTVLPEFSTIGNLSKTLFNIGHPDIVTFLRP